MDFLIFLISGFVLVSMLLASGAARAGVPVLIVFLLAGLAFGPDGIGILATHENPKLALVLGNIGLAVILFDGGLHAKPKHLRLGLAPACILATLGVCVTVSIVAGFAMWFLDFSWLGGLLLGAVVGSTDAAAVFSLIHTAKLNLKPKIEAILELESGLNDPMAILLTMTATELLSGGDWTMKSILFTLFEELAIGGLLGWLGGFGLAELLRWVRLPIGLYPLLALAGGLTIFGATNALGGSGYLAIYWAGIILASRPIHDCDDIRRVHHGFAWIAQIVMFLSLGLLINPAGLVDYALPAIGIAAVLAFVARPIATWVSLIGFGLSWQKKAFISFTGIRGAVPIVLALYPLIAGIPEASTVLNVAFFVVMISLLVQGTNVPTMAKWLDLDMAPVHEADQRIDLDLQPGLKYDMVGYLLEDDSRMIGRHPIELSLPVDVRWAAVFRNGQPLVLDESFAFQVGDAAYLIVPRDRVEAMDRLFSCPKGVSCSSCGTRGHEGFEQFC